MEKYNIQKLLEDIPTNWSDILLEIYNRDDMKEKLLNTEKTLNEFNEKWNGRIKIFPPIENTFKSFSFVGVKRTKIVILGQDPYHGEGQAMGLSFSVPDGIKVPPSLVNIYKELLNNKMKNGKCDFIKPSNGDLTKWAEQGVILLNTALTVQESKANSHKKMWDFFTDAIIEEISNQCGKVVFLLWGAHAKKKKDLIDCQKHLVLESNHPSPLSAHTGWYNNKHFEKANIYLKENGIKRVEWCLDNEE